jgi:cytochrome P450
VAWALHELSINEDIQTRLREELRTIPLPGSSGPLDALDPDTTNALNSLPLLDAVVRETVRLYPPSWAVVREAVEDDVVPLATPLCSQYGELHDSFRHVRHYRYPYLCFSQTILTFGDRVKKGDTIFIPMLMINRYKAFWGENAHEFK